MKERKIKDLIEKGEGQESEFKSKFTNDIGKDICAFANTNNGIIAVGVDDKGVVVGASKKISEQIADIATSCDPPVRVAIKTGVVHGKNILIAKVKKSEQVHGWKGKVYVRVGSTNRALSMQEILELGQKLGKIRFDEQICKGATIADIDEDKVKWFLLKAKTERNLDVESGIPIEDALRKLDLMIDNNLTNTAVLMFGKNPQRFFLQTEVRCAKFKGAEAVKRVRKL